MVDARLKHRGRDGHDLLIVPEAESGQNMCTLDGTEFFRTVAFPTHPRYRGTGRDLAALLPWNALARHALKKKALKPQGEPP
jgi:hypothetical protein